MFQQVTFKICVIITVYCINWLPWTSTGSSDWEVFLEMNLTQKTLQIYTPKMHWKNQCRSTIRKHALLWDKHKYQYPTDIFVKNIFNPFNGTGLFLYYLKYIRSQRFPNVFRRLKDTSAMKWVKSHFIFSYLFCYLFK